MASIVDVYQASIELKDAIVAGKPVGAWKSSLVIQAFAIEKLEGFGVQGVAEDAATLANIKTCLEECEHELTKAQSSAVGKWGDGKLLSLLLEVIKTVLPLLI